MPLGSGLEADGQGSVQTPGSTPTEPSAYLHGANGFVGVGSGLQIGATGELEKVGGYIYCTPAYPELPVSIPPYNCNTEVNTAGVTDFTEAWYGCFDIVEFPCVDTSSGVEFMWCWEDCENMEVFPPLNLSSGANFRLAWSSCSSLVSFPLVDVSSGQNFEWSWRYCESLLTSFPTLDVSNGENFNGAWLGCESLTSFPTLNFSSGQSFEDTWRDCTNLVNFPANVFDTCQATYFSSAWYNCALSQQSVDNILISLDFAGQSDGLVETGGGTSSAPGPAGLAAKLSLQAKGWSILTN